jgi:hypothetical protein
VEIGGNQRASALEVSVLPTPVSPWFIKQPAGRAKPPVVHQPCLPLSIIPRIVRHAKKQRLCLAVGPADVAVVEIAKDRGGNGVDPAQHVDGQGTDLPLGRFVAAD